MFSSGPNYNKLKTNLRLALNRLKLLEKKKSELTQKSRKEIADYLATGKTERARIRVEHIIREDYLVEAMEIVEMYCDLLLARFGLITQMKELDAGIAEPVSSLVWVCPRLQSDIAELKVISDIFIHKYGPQFAEHSRTATGEHFVSEKLMHKLTLQAPPKLLVEKYLIAIAKNYNIEYEPDPQVMQEEQKPDQQPQAHLIDLSDRNNLSGGSGGAPPPQMGFIGYPAVPPLPSMPEPPTSKPFNYPPFGGGGGGGAAAMNPMQPPPPFAYNIPPNQPPAPAVLPSKCSGNVPEEKDLNTNFINETKEAEASGSGGSCSPDENILRPKPDYDPPPRYTSINPVNLQNANKPKPQPRSKLPPGGPAQPSAPPDIDLPSLPNVPLDLPDVPSPSSGGGKKDDDDEIDFDDLSRRFENLKKRK
ncbi:IST1 homolog isoform X2 [Drosophila willistoni]|uniref:IST1 homolog isoform X2 n=1 Tax=Drosophila willistoni TaxID=7260 RepID=UPI000C26C3D0|nr:IST1 homolog isoform X2 [Drosophila willistoni]